jgi:hypothetical protein
MPRSATAAAQRPAARSRGWTLPVVTAPAAAARHRRRGRLHPATARPSLHAQPGALGATTGPAICAPQPPDHPEPSEPGHNLGGVSARHMPQWSEPGSAKHALQQWRLKSPARENRYWQALLKCAEPELYRGHQTVGDNGDVSLTEDGRLQASRARGTVVHCQADIQSIT